MVRLSAVLCKVRYAKRQKYIREKKGVYSIENYSYKAERILKAKGIAVVDPLTYINPPPKKWEPPKNLPQDFRLERFRQKVVEKPKENEVWHLTSSTTFSEGIDQACLLTKTQRFDGLPKQVEDLIGRFSLTDESTQVKDAIRYSQIWNNTKEKLPRHVDIANMGWKFPIIHGIPDSISGHILADSFLKLAQIMGGMFPSLFTDRRVCCKPSVETSYKFKGETIEILCNNEMMVVGQRPLTQFGDNNMINESVNHQLLDMYPVLPTVDFVKTYPKKLLNRGTFREVLEIPCSHPQMIFRVNSDRRRPEAFQALNLMLTFGVAIAEARNRYGTDSGQLETPVTIINVNNSYNVFNYLVFQLNTMDFDNEDGVKNFVWFDSEKLFSKNFCQPWLAEDKSYKPPTYTDFNSDVFRKFLALYLYDYAK